MVYFYNILLIALQTSSIVSVPLPKRVDSSVTTRTFEYERFLQPRNGSAIAPFVSQVYPSDSVDPSASHYLTFMPTETVNEPGPDFTSVAPITSIIPVPPAAPLTSVFSVHSPAPVTSIIPGKRPPSPRLTRERTQDHGPSTFVVPSVYHSPIPSSARSSSRRSRNRKTSRAKTATTTSKHRTIGPVPHSPVPKSTIVTPRPAPVPRPARPTTISSVSLKTTVRVSVIQTLTVTTTVYPGTSGTIKTSLQTSGQNTAVPYRTIPITTPPAPLQPKPTVPLIPPNPNPEPVVPLSNNIFVPIATGPPPPQISARSDHPVRPRGVRKSGPVQTNKFYANFFLGSQNTSAWTHPYSIAWVRGQGITRSWGISVSHVTRDQTAYGPGNPAAYYINPLGIQSLVLSAGELGPSTALQMTELTGYSCNVGLAPGPGTTSVVNFPLVQGMGFITAVYSSGTPVLQSSVFFRKLSFGGNVGSGTVRYLATLADGNTWSIYITPSRGSTAPVLTLVNRGQIMGNRRFAGSIQVAKMPVGPKITEIQRIYDASAGVYPTGGSIQGQVNGARGTYQFAWTKAGVTAKSLLMFALPHHLQSLAPVTKGAVREIIKLQTTTKGVATAIQSDSWTMIENDLPITMRFAPWTPSHGSRTSVPAEAMRLINRVGATELNEDFNAQTNLDSMYFSGKALAKFAFALYAVEDLAKNRKVASAGLAKLKQALARFISNNQIFPLVYDSVWGGTVSSATYVTGNSLADFGNTYYNDHHFHYGYFVFTAAVIGYLDPSWLNQGTNKAWVNSLVRDYANPVSDQYFPISRMFDWYHGHSWAHGIFETADGKDQESSSEDTFALYAIKMWGYTVGDMNMEARGNLMLAVQARSLANYYLMENDNTAEPPRFIGNKAVGILFENKMDHTTYFGTNIEYIEGIHMLPLHPASSLTRKAEFVREEWNAYFSNGRADAIAGGWRGILYANLAIISPKLAYRFFAQEPFDMSWLDSGASRTWYLAWSAGLGGAN